MGDGEEVPGKLSAEERNGFQGAFCSVQADPSILLLGDEGRDYEGADIARSLQVGRATVERVRRRCVEEGLERAAAIAASGGSPLDCPGLAQGAGQLDAAIVANGLVEREIVESISSCARR